MSSSRGCGWLSSSRARWRPRIRSSRRSGGYRTISSRCSPRVSRSCWSKTATMDQAIRNKLRNVVTQCRRLLEESIAQQLQGKYDIYATGKKDEVKADEDVPVGHLSDEERQARQDILAHFKHIEALGYKPRETLEQLIREIAFTHLNRLCAYKMMEVRDVYVEGQKFREAVSKGLKSQGFLFYLAENPDEEKPYNAGHQEEAYRHFLNWLGGTLSQEIGVLFSPTDPANRVYPPQRVLDEVLDLLNSEELKGIWSEDETIGWVYQYFTPKELRDQARKESQARVMKSCPGACSSLIPDLLRIWACRRLVSAVIVLTRRASLRTISRRHG